MKCVKKLIVFLFKSLYRYALQKILQKAPQKNSAS